MKHKYKINIDQPVPDDEQIARHQDFGRILADYHNLTQPIYRKPLYKNPKAFIGLVLILTIGALVFFAVEEEDKAKAEQEQIASIPQEVILAEENSFLQPPVPSLRVPATSTKLDLTKAQEIALPDGSKLSIPANALGAADGSAPNSTAQLHIRQLSSVAALISAGLPMQLDGHLISPTAVMEITATQDGVEGPEQLVLAPNARITLEVPVADDALQARQLLTLDPKARTWRSASAAPVTPHARPAQRASIDRNDGFGVVEYDANGKVIPRPKPAPGGDKAIQVLQVDLNQLGIICLGEMNAPASGGVPYRVRFTDASGQPLRLLSLYGIAQGRNTVEFLWPKTADFAFEIKVAPGVVSSYVGFLPDGRFASIKQVTAMPETQSVHVLKMEVTAAPVKDIASLTQLLDDLHGH